MVSSSGRVGIFTAHTTARAQLSALQAVVKVALVVGLDEVFDVVVVTFLLQGLFFVVVGTEGEVEAAAVMPKRTALNRERAFILAYFRESGDKSRRRNERQ